MPTCVNFSTESGRLRALPAKISENILSTLAYCIKDKITLQKSFVIFASEKNLFNGYVSKQWLLFTGDLFYKTFNGRNLRIFAIS